MLIEEISLGEAGDGHMAVPGLSQGYFLHQHPD
jgi:hypothetical protein